MLSENKFETDADLECNGRFIALRKLGVRSSFLFANFFLIITAYYQLKPASRSLFLEVMGAKQLPYVWILTAAATIIFISVYNRIVKQYSRIHVVMGTCLIISLVLILFRIALNTPSVSVAIGFYVFVDIVGVVMVEQFWSLANAIYSTREGKSWYGFVGTGGLVGGVAGGSISAMLISKTPLETPDLLISASGTILIIFSLTWAMGRLGMYCESGLINPMKPDNNSRLKNLLANHYLLLIGSILLIAQLISPIIEYQFLNTIEVSFPQREDRTAYLSAFFSVMSLVSIGINLGITPVIHRLFGTIAGLMAQPLMISASSIFFMAMPSDVSISAAKICDRGLSYSINRASKELLYVPIDPVLIYQAKAWLDMLGYRLFKVLGSFIILLLTQWLPISIELVHLSWITIFFCGIWIFSIMALKTEYQVMTASESV